MAETVQLTAVSQQKKEHRHAHTAFTADVFSRILHILMILI